MPFKRGKFRAAFLGLPVCFQPNCVQSWNFLLLKIHHAASLYIVHFYEIWFCSVLLQAVCEEALKSGPQVGLFLDAVVFGGEDFRASIGIKHISLFFSLRVCMYLCVSMYVYVCIFSLPLHERTFT